jgi:NAD(P) transhydrogenase subunit alpha
MGVGVAGLQAIATARRLGAIVTATDVRPATKEQVERSARSSSPSRTKSSRGATAGGYAKEMSKEYQAKQAALTAEHIKKQDIVITTALIPGRPAPKLVTGNGRVDEAGLGDRRSRGRARRQLSKARSPARSSTTDNGVKIVGHLNVAGPLAGRRRRSTPRTSSPSSRP